jgi:hypothetical protein
MNAKLRFVTTSLAVHRSIPDVVDVADFPLHYCFFYIIQVLKVLMINLPFFNLVLAI